MVDFVCTVARKQGFRLKLLHYLLVETHIMNTQLLQQASVLAIDEQIELVEAIWNGIVSLGKAPAPTQSQGIELDRRLSDLMANPNDVVSWNDVKAASLAAIGR
jgi:putative addiction module component (TIGR02574 family)